MKNTQRGFIGIAIIIILAATIGGGIYYKEKINPDFLSRKDDSGERLPIKEIDKKTGDSKAEVVATPTATVSSNNDIKITPPSIPSTSVSLAAAKKDRVDQETSVGVKVCSDAKCFTDAINACVPAKFTRSSGGEIIGGSIVDAKFTYETQVDCNIKRTLNSYKISASEGMLEFAGGKDAITTTIEDGKVIKETTTQFMSRFNTKSQIMVGKSDICAKKDFIASFSANTDYYFTLGMYECEGDLTKTIESFK